MQHQSRRPTAPTLAAATLAAAALAALTIPGGASAQETSAVRHKVSDRPKAQPACALGDIGAGAVRSVLDGRTFQLADGREVRLAAIEAPEPSGGDGDAAAARAALAALALGREVTLKRLGPDPGQTDRYGRLAVHAFVVGQEASIQKALLAQGFARVAARVGNPACAAELLAAEGSARSARLGLWAGPQYAMRQAGNPAEVLAERGRFALVEGKVLSVRESGAVLYVNFGRRWSEDFTVTVLKRHERGFAAAGLELRKLGGRHVRVRGHVEERGGPWIEVTRPEQIEIAERD